jgi:hypothetical protein
VVGNIHSLEQVQELAYFGYDGVVLGRNLAEVRNSIYLWKRSIGDNMSHWTTLRIAYAKNANCSSCKWLNGRNYITCNVQISDVKEFVDGVHRLTLPGQGRGAGAAMALKGSLMGT